MPHSHSSDPILPLLSQLLLSLCPFNRRYKSECRTSTRLPKHFSHLLSVSQLPTESDYIHIHPRDDCEACAIALHHVLTGSNDLSVIAFQTDSPEVSRLTQVRQGHTSHLCTFRNGRPTAKHSQSFTRKRLNIQHQDTVGSKWTESQLVGRPIDRAGCPKLAGKPTGKRPWIQPIFSDILI
jgi:hypothetical protein